MMPGSLSPEQIAQYRRDGFVFPVDCLTAAEVAHYRGRLEAFERLMQDLPGDFRERLEDAFSEQLAALPLVHFRAEDVVVDQQMREPQVLRGVGERGDGARVGSDLRLRED